MLHIYGLHCPLTSDLHVIANDCVTIRLSFVPFVLTHSTLLQDSAPSSSGSSGWHSPPVDILLAGSDKSVHVYRWSTVTQSYSELPFTPAHPLSHLHGTPSAVLSLDVACAAERPDAHTYVVAGCQDGLVRVATRRSARTRSRSHANISGEAAAGASWEGGGADSGQVAAVAPSLDLSDLHTDSAAAAEYRCSDFYLEGPVASAKLFSPSSFLSDVFRSRSPDEQLLNDSPLNRMQRRAYAQCRDDWRTRCQDDCGSDEERGEDEGEEFDSESESEWSANSSARGFSDGLVPQAPLAEVRLLMANAVGFGAVYGSVEQRIALI